ncbi:MAG: hypothetical protein F4X25_07565 [Chloroflexi bacterium]|nr:hypothetical protein [Chloroflexota bacterium]
MRRPGPLALVVGALAVVACSTSAIRAQTPPEQQNLLPNGGFEQGLVGWAQPAPATLDVVEEPTHSGGSAGRVTASGPGSVTLLTQYSRVPVEPGTEHTLQLAVRDPDGYVRDVRLEFLDGEGARVAIEASLLPSTPSASWQQVEVGPVTAPRDAAYARLVVRAEATGAGSAFHVDSAELSAGPAPEPTSTPTATPPEAPATEPASFASLTNGDFELPGETAWGWRAHAGEVAVASEGGTRVATLTSRGPSTVWLHQSFAVEGGRWYEAAGLLRPVANAALARLRVGWYASEDASGAQLSTADSNELIGISDSFARVSTGPIRAPVGARSAQLRVMLRPAGGAPAILHADGLSFARTAPPPNPAVAPSPATPPTPEAMPTFFLALTNGDFELPGDTPYGWRAHAGDVVVGSEGDSRSVTLTSRGRSTAWLHQSFAVEGGRWYEAAGLLRAVSNAALVRIRIAWYGSEDASGAQLSTDDSNELTGFSDSFAEVSTGAIRAPEEARSAELRVMLRPASGAPAVLNADDVSFERTAPPPPELTSQAPIARPPQAPEPSFFASLTNGDFELPGDTPYGWRAHAGEALVTSEGATQAALLTSRGAATAWLHQSVRVEGGRWYQASGRLRGGPNAAAAVIRVAWYASDDASGPQLSATDSVTLEGASDSFVPVSTGAVLAPGDARSAQLRIMLRPLGEAPATLHADDVAFTRTAPPPAPAVDVAEAAAPTPEATPEPSFFAALTNGDFELPGETPYGWRSHAADAAVTSHDGSRVASLTSRSSTAAWLHQSFSVGSGGWYEAGGRLRLVSDASLARLRVAWYASEDASGPQLSAADSEAVEDVDGSFASVSTGAIRAPDDARSAQLRIMLRPAGEAPAVLHADNVTFVRSAAPPPASSEAPPEAGEAATSVVPPSAASAAAPIPTLEPYRVRSASAILLRITELLPNPPQGGGDAEYEWIEVGNVGTAAVSLAGLILVDNHGRIALPTLTLPPGGAFVVAGPRAAIGDALALRRGEGLFNGLGNSGDRLALATEGGAVIDALSYGSDGSVDQPPLRAPPAGRSLQRRFDAAGRLIDALVAELPSPGRIEAHAPAEAGAPPPAATPPPAPPGPGGPPGAGGGGRRGRRRAARTALERRVAAQAARRGSGQQPHGLDRARLDRRGRPRGRRRAPCPRAAAGRAAAERPGFAAPEAALATLRERRAGAAEAAGPVNRGAPALTPRRRRRTPRA